MSPDDLALARFRVDFDKLFGAAPALRKEPAFDPRRQEIVERIFPSSALRKEYAAADDGGKLLVLLETQLERVAASYRLEKRAALAKLTSENRALRLKLDGFLGELDLLARKVEAMEAEIADFQMRKAKAEQRAFRLPGAAALHNGSVH